MSSNPRLLPLSGQDQSLNLSDAAQSPSTVVSSSHISAAPDRPEPLQNPLSKQWDLPPRPKPGRKPAVDTPPTKRKAQNRQAQRAFRERRAARVAELETEITEINEANQTKINELMEQVAYLQRSLETERLQHSSTQHLWKRQVYVLEAALAASPNCAKSLEQFGWSTSAASTASISSTSTAPPTSRSSWELSPTTPLDPIPFLPDVNVPRGEKAAKSGVDSVSIPSCESCGKDGRCACLEQVLADGAAEPPEGQHALTSTAALSSTNNKTNDEDVMELDFTAQFARPPKPIVSSASHTDMGKADQSSMLVDDHCGFCTSESSCICRSTHSQQPADEVAMTEGLPVQGSNNGIRNRLPAIEPPATANGPSNLAGSCPSCQIDPERRQFCQALSALTPAERSSALTDRNASSTLISLSKPHGSQSFQQDALTQPNRTLPSLLQQMIKATWDDKKHLPPELQNAASRPEAYRLSCADAYTFLRDNDPAFPAKKDSITFMQSLRPVPASKRDRHCDTCDKTGCSPLEVDCASVLAAMKTGSSQGTSIPPSNDAR